MTLPRFNSGRIGPADYSDWNRVMAAAEEVEAMPRTARSVPKETRPLYAKLTEAIPASSWLLGYSGFKWVEVMASRNEPGAKWEWKALPSGLTWSGFAGGPAYAVSLGGASVGDIVELRRVPSMVGDAGPLGEVWFLVVPMGAAAEVASGVVVGVTSDGDPLTLGYAGYIVARHQNVEVDLLSANALAVYALNMPEIAAGLQSQVQTESPGTKTLLRLPVGTPVGPMSKMPKPGLELWCFSMPNAYEVVC